MAFGNKIDDFGSTDILHITARDNLENILSIELLPQTDIVSTLYLANDLELMGQPVGISELEYNFLERIGGSLKTFIFEQDGNIWTRGFIDWNGKLYKKVAGMGSTSTNEDDIQFSPDPATEVFSDTPSYIIEFISPNRKELVIDKKHHLKNELYNIQFSNLKFDTDFLNRIADGYYFENTETNIFSTNPAKDSGYIEKDVWEVFTAGLDLGDKSTIELTIPNYFIDTVDEVTETEVRTEYYIEPKPSGAPGPADDYVSEFGQWVWDPVETSWAQNVKGISYDENNVPIWPQDKLINGYPLHKAVDPTLFDNGQPLLPGWPKDFDGNFLFIESFTDPYDGHEDYTFNQQFLYWYDHNIENGMWVYKADPTFRIGDLSQNDIADLDSGDNSAIEFMKDHMYRDENDPFFTKTIEEEVTREIITYRSYESRVLSYGSNAENITEFGLEVSVKEYAERNGIDLFDIVGVNDKDNLQLNFKNTVRDVEKSDIAILCNKVPYVVTNKMFAENKLLVMLDKPLPGTIDVGKDVIFTKIALNPQSYPINYVTYQAPPPPTNVLRLPVGGVGNASKIRERSTEALSYDDLIQASSSVAKDIERDIVSGSFNSVDLNIDYSNYDKFIKFSSARRRLENFKTKLEKIEEYTDKSSSIAGTLSSAGYLGQDANTALTARKDEAERWEIAVNEVINTFDGYERYLYFDSSSYSSGSAGLFYDASWPKTTSTKPYTLLRSTNSTAVDWYNLNHTSASTYDTENLDRLIYHLPDHIRDDRENQDFIKFVDMMGQHFDNLKNYIDRFGQVYETDEALSKGLSKELIYSVAKSFGWELQDGYDLIKLDKFLFGKSVDSDNQTTLYASSSLQDVSREIWKRIIANMPFFLKSKGTVDALKGLINCYGISSTILRVREFGGPTVTDVNPIYETSRRFTKAVDFKAASFVSSSWSKTLGLGGTKVPNSMEFRFKAVSSSNMTIVQGGGEDGNNWGFHLRDNGSTDNIGRIVFSLSGSTNNDTKVPSTEGWGAEAVSTYVTMSSAPLPFYNGDFWSVLLRRSPSSQELIGNVFETGSFGSTTAGHIVAPDTPSEYNDIPFSAAEHGTLLINSASAYTRPGSTYSLKMTHTQATVDVGDENDKTTRVATNLYTYPYRNSDGKIYDYGGNNRADARFVTGSYGQTFDFSVYARTETNTATMEISVLELDDKGKVLNWGTRNYHTENIPNNYGIHSFQDGIYTNWKRLRLRVTLKQPNVKHLSLRMAVKKRSNDPNNVTLNPNVYVDDGSLRRVFGNDTTDEGYKYDLIVKQWDAGRDTMLYQDNVSTEFLTSVSSSFNNKFDETGSLWIGGGTTKDFGGQFSGSMMEFRLWKSSLDEKPFNEHVENPQSFAGNSISASYEDIALRYSFNEDKNHSSDSSVRDTSTDQSSPLNGIATGFANENNYSDVVDRTKFPLPQIGGIRVNNNKIRLEDARYIKSRVGNLINLNPTERIEESEFDRSPLDLNRVGVYFSPVDVINQDIMNQMSDFNFDNYLGDSRDDLEYSYRGLDQMKEEYFKKYTGANNFFDYLRVLEYYDHSLFRQLESLLPARAKGIVGVLVENNVLERNKQPINHPTQENPVYESTIQYNAEEGETVEQTAENEYFEVSQSVTHLDKEIDADSTHDLTSENQYYDSTINVDSDKPTIRDLNRVDKFGWFGRNYTTSSIYIGGPSSVFTESINVIDNQRVSDYNQDRHYIYSTKENFIAGTASSVSFVTSSFEKITENVTALRRIMFEGSKNDVDSAPYSLDENGEKDYKPVAFILTSPTRLTGDARDSLQIRTEFDIDESG